MGRDEKRAMRNVNEKCSMRREMSNRKGAIGKGHKKIVMGKRAMGKSNEEEPKAKRKEQIAKGQGGKRKGQKGKGKAQKAEGRGQRRKRKAKRGKGKDER
jgi:hypothetical protein